MPKRAVRCEEIIDKNRRNTTSKARLHGLMKKIGEWTIMCGTEFLSFAITNDGVVTAFSSMGDTTRHLDRIFQIYNQDPSQTKYYIENYDKRNVMPRFKERHISYIDPRKRQMQKRKKKKLKYEVFTEDESSHYVIDLKPIADELSKLEDFISNIEIIN